MTEQRVSAGLRADQPINAVPALDRDDLDGAGQAILDAIEAAHKNDLLYDRLTTALPIHAAALAAYLAPEPVEGPRPEPGLPAEPPSDPKLLLRLATDALSGAMTQVPDFNNNVGMLHDATGEALRALTDDEAEALSDWLDVRLAAKPAATASTGLEELAMKAEASREDRDDG